MKSSNMHMNTTTIEIHGVLKAGVLFCLMGDGESSKRASRTIEMENLSLDIPPNRFSRDLLQRFMGNSSNEYEASKGENHDEIELNLGLSLGGRFGVDKSVNKLARSSSVASCLPIVRDDNDVVITPPVTAYSGLVRTSSLPVETEEEWRKKKELQSLRRMEAKRRRSEKQRSLKEGGISISRGVSLSLEERKEIEVNLRGRLEREKSLSVIKRQGSLVGPQSGLSNWVNQAILRGGIDVVKGKGKGSYLWGGDGVQGSIESKGSKGGSSSSVSDLESKAMQGSSGELSSTSIQSMQEGTNQDSTPKSREQHTRKTHGPEMESPSKRPEMSKARAKETTGTNPLEDMPCVFTKGDGPNGRRVDGILYKYGKGEDVRIMCVCHGNFHSPVEFVKHAGGTDIDNPHKHIIVNPNASGML